MFIFYVYPKKSAHKLPGTNTSDLGLSAHKSPGTNTNDLGLGTHNHLVPTPVTEDLVHTITWYQHQ